MPTTFNAFYLGNLADIDTLDGNSTAENAAALVGQTFGGPGNALFNDMVSWSAVGNPGTSYNQNNSPAEQFSIDGGPARTFDSSAIYNATITYLDGTTATITAVIAQDTAGNTYLAPEYSANADQAALEAGAIRSITLDSLAGNVYSGLTASRQTWEVVTCFAAGTRIATPSGPRPIEDLAVGDPVETLDRGPQPLRWIGRRRVAAQGGFAPILFRAGALGNDRDLRVSPNHRMLLRGWRCEFHTGEAEALVAAKHLVNGRDIRRDPGGSVSYVHLLFDRHEVIRAEGCLTESFHPGAVGWSAMEAAARREILALFPVLAICGPDGFGPTARRIVSRREARLSVPPPDRSQRRLPPAMAAS